MVWEQRPGTIKQKHTSEVACDHWNRYLEDFNLITKLLNNAYCMSIEGSRIFPDKTTIDHDAIEHYHKMIDELLKRNITPFVAVHHFTKSYLVGK